MSKQSCFKDYLISRSTDTNALHTLTAGWVLHAKKPKSAIIELVQADDVRNVFEALQDTSLIHCLFYQHYQELNQTYLEIQAESPRPVRITRDIKADVLELGLRRAAEDLIRGYNDRQDGWHSQAQS